MRPTQRVLAAAALLGAWLGLLLSGRALGGAVHLLAVVAVLVAPWRSAATGRSDPEENR